MAQSKTGAKHWVIAVMIATGMTKAIGGEARDLAVPIDPGGVAHVAAALSQNAVPMPQIVGSGSTPQLSATPLGQGTTAGLKSDVDRGLPTCGVIAPPSIAEAEALVRRVAEAEDFYPDFVLSVARIESHFRADQASPKGAVGLMQLMPATAARYDVNICDPADNVRGGVRYLRALHDRYRNPIYMLAAYNAGEDAVEHYRGVPPYPETVRYVADVINDFYTLPSPGTAAPGGVAKRTPEPRSVATAQPEAGWSQGFVMHVEN